MTLIRHGRGPNPLKGWQLNHADIRYVGHDLQRPECILAERDGTLWSADARGGVMRIGADGAQQLVVQSASSHFDVIGDPAGSLLTGTLPNGLAIARDRSFLIANFGTDRLERMERDGTTTVVADSIDGQPLGKVNFVLVDRRGRTWITISTRHNPWSEAIRPDLADGYVAVFDKQGLRIVADGFSFANELRLDAAEEWLYVAETARRRVTRLRIAPGGELGEREVFGPDGLGTGFIDGITFDTYGNLWATMVFADRLIAITPDGDVLNLFEDGDPVGLAALEAEVTSGGAPTFDALMRCGGNVCPWMASVTFGGPALDTVYLGGLRATTIPSFTSPVRGEPLSHW